MGSVSSIGKDKDAMSDRRRHTRYAGDGLMVWVEGRIYPAIDVSLGGVRLSGGDQVRRGAVVDLKLIPCHGEVMMLGKAATAQGQVLAAGPSGTRLAFVSPRYSLAKTVVRHARLQHLDGVFSPPVG
jgi:hypothetical protein